MLDRTLGALHATNTLRDFISVGTNQWDILVKELDNSEIQKIDSMAMSESVICAMLSTYLGHRGSNGCGDDGHEEAMKQAEKMRKRARKAVGYSYP